MLASGQSPHRVKFPRARATARPADPSLGAFSYEGGITPARLLLFEMSVVVSNALADRLFKNFTSSDKLGEVDVVVAFVIRSSPCE